MQPNLKPTTQVVNGITYNLVTPKEVIEVLEQCRLNKTRIYLSFGETQNTDPSSEKWGTKGKDWLEEFGIIGTIGHSTGEIKIPLIFANTLCKFGQPILDNCIVRIREAKGGKILYRHPNYHHGEIELRQIKGGMLRSGKEYCTDVEIYRDGKLHRRFPNFAQANRWVKKMGLKIDKYTTI